jgi:GNAT superfamily N-acetyltransferase
MISIPDAIEVFVHGFCHGKSRTYPYKATKVGNLWVMRDSPPRKKERKIEVISHGLTPQKTTQTIQDAELGWHFLCDIHAPDADFQAIRNQYKELGYRAISTEWLFAHDLQEIPGFESDPPTLLIQDQEALNQINQIAPQPQKLLPGTRQFAIWDASQDYGWVTSIPCGESAWVSALYVHKEHRGKGFGRSLMIKLLQTDREHGVKQSVLLASSDGARLYPHLGYQQIGVLQMFCPIRRN